MLIGLSVFGSVHLVAWNIPFPSRIEQLLWRIGAITIAALPLPLLLDLLIHQRFEHRMRHWFQVGYFAGSLVLFVIARLFLLVEAFRSTYFLPPDSYLAT